MARWLGDALWLFPRWFSDEVNVASDDTDHGATFSLFRTQKIDQGGNDRTESDLHPSYLNRVQPATQETFHLNRGEPHAHVSRLEVRRR